MKESDGTRDPDGGVDRLAMLYQAARGELIAYLTRLVVRPEVAEELAQEAALRLVSTPGVPQGSDGVRAWLFRVATNLGIDHLRRHSSWRETVLLEARQRAERDPTFLAASRQLVGSPQVAAIAREHLAVCLACTLRNLPPEQAAALLLVEIHGFAVAEAADLLAATFGQTKNWLQRARETLRARYAATCALVTKQGVCHQCVELASYFGGQPADPLAGSRRDLEARLTVVREQRGAATGPWHRLLLGVVDDVLGR